MSKIRKLEIEKAIRKLKEATRSSEMKDANFGNRRKQMPNEDISDYIREVTRLYRKSWLTTPIESALKILEHELNR